MGHATPRVVFACLAAAAASWTAAGAATANAATRATVVIGVNPADATTFTVSPDAAAAADTAAATTQLRLNASAAANHAGEPSLDAVFLAVGVHTDLERGAAARQAIRETWGDAATAAALGVRVWFVAAGGGCARDLATVSDPALREAIAAEKATHGDLLTDELRCRQHETQSNDRVDSTVEFMHFALAPTTSSPSSPSPAFVMMVDDNVYVRLDALVALLRSDDGVPKERAYIGNSATPRERGPHAPERDPRRARFVSLDDYPMPELPPYVSGAHYVVSRDVAEFIALNREDLQGLAGLDDVTLALWMLALQVHPTFVDRFHVLARDAPHCADDLVSLAGVAPTALRRIHANVRSDGEDAGRLCKDFDDADRRDDDDDLNRPDTTAAVALTTALRFGWDVQHDPASESLHIRVDLLLGERVVASRVYVPARGPYGAVFCPPLLDAASTALGKRVDAALCDHHRRELLAFLADRAQLVPALRAKLQVARHNLARAQHDADAAVVSPVLTVVLSRAARYTRVVLECLLSQVYASHHLVVRGEEEQDGDEEDAASPPPDVVVFSILDELRRSAHGGGLVPPDDTSPPAGARFVARYAATSKLLFVSGEAWPAPALDARVTALSTVAFPRHAKHVFLPYASAAFGEMVRGEPMQLLAPRGGLDDQQDAPPRPRRFCAFLYANCAVPTRDLMLELVSAIAPVDALGRCKGARLAPDDSRFAQRYVPFYSDAAVELYRGYKFVIAFENAVARGYVTEKIVTALLAGAVPVYYGDATLAARLFNADAFINCGAFATLRACADRVRVVHETPALYAAMRAAPAVTNRAAFDEFFSWHPAVADAIAIADADKLQQQQQNGSSSSSPPPPSPRLLHERLAALL